MYRPANLGGDAPARAQPGTSSVEADFIQAYQDPQTGQWLCRVRLDGGRVLTRVRFLYPSSRVRSGSRPMLPATGERGIVLYPSAARQVSLAYWIGSIDHYTFGPNNDHPDADVQTHPSGQASILSKNGDYLWRYANGTDRILQDDNQNAESLAPQHRDKQSKLQPTQSPKTDVDSRWMYDGQHRGAFFGGKLKHEPTGNAANLWADNLKAQWLASFSTDTSLGEVGAVDGKTSLTSKQEDRQLSVVLNSAQASIHLNAQGASAVSVALDAQTGKLTASAPTSWTITSSNNGILSAGNSVTVQTPTFMTTGVTRLAQGYRPAAFGDATDRNFAKIALVLGLALEPTSASKVRIQ